MATSSEQQTNIQQTQAFPFYTKRKLETNEASLSLVYENGVFVPRSEKRQRFNGEFKEFEAVNLDQNNLSVIPNAEVQQTGFQTSQCEQNMDTDSEMIEETVYSTTMEDISAQTVNGEGIFNVVPSEARTETPKTTNGLNHINYQRTKTLNCTIVPSVHSYCFQGGLLDNMLVNYHGL